MRTRAGEFSPAADDRAGGRRSCFERLVPVGVAACAGARRSRFRARRNGAGGRCSVLRRMGGLAARQARLGSVQSLEQGGQHPAVCARCHSTPGFLDYLGADGSAAGKVDHPAPIGTVITCVACHNDKAVDLTSVTFPSGLKAEHQGNDARCMSCHQGVESTDSVNRAVKRRPRRRPGRAEARFRQRSLQGCGRHAVRRTHGEGRLRVSRQDLCGAFAAPATLWPLSWLPRDHALTVKFNDCAACHREVTDKASLHKIRRQQGRP